MAEKYRFGFFETYHSGEIVPCTDNKCNKPIRSGDQIIVDTENEKIYCHPCGQCHRYSKKKEVERANRKIDIVQLPVGFPMEE